MQRLRLLITPGLFLLVLALPISIAAMNAAIAILLAVLVLAGTYEERRRAGWAALPLAPWAGAIALAYVASDTAPFDALRFVFPWSALPLAYAFAPRLDGKRWMRLFLAAVSIAALVGIVQHLHGIDVLDSPLCQYETPKDHGKLHGSLCGYKDGTRARGFFYTPMTFGAVLMFGLLVTTALLRKKNLSGKSGFSAAALMLAALVVTSSRNAWVGFAAAVPIVIGRSRRMWVAAGVAVILVVMLVATVPVLRARATSFGTLDRSPTSSMGARLFLWEDAWQQFLENPLLGSGPDTFRQNVERRHPNVELLSTRHAHNDYLQALAETGIVGLAGMLASWIWIGLRLWRRRSDPFARGGLACWVSFAAAGIFEANYLDTEVVINLFTWTALGLWQKADSSTATRESANGNSAFKPVL